MTRQEDPLDGPVAGEHHERPDGDARRSARRGSGEMPKISSAAAAPENSATVLATLATSRTIIAKTVQRTPEPVADQVGQALPGDDAEPGGHLLDDGQDDDRDREEPQQRQPGRGAHDAVGRDAAGVVAGDPGDEPGAHDREEREQAPPAAEPAAQPRRGRRARDAIAARRAETRSSTGLAPRRPARSCTRRRQLAGRIVSMASSTVTIPTSRSSSSTTGTASRL